VKQIGSSVFLHCCCASWVQLLECLL
jgi:hypothetical protein